MHTPGPWIIPDWKQLGRIEVIGSKEVVVAAVYLQPDPISVKGWPTEEANARLIAAAPELLEVVKDMVGNGVLTSKLRRAHFLDILESGKEAIAKATDPA